MFKMSSLVRAAVGPVMDLSLLLPWLAFVPARLRFERTLLMLPVSELCRTWWEPVGDDAAMMMDRCLRQRRAFLMDLCRKEDCLVFELQVKSTSHLQAPVVGGTGRRVHVVSFRHCLVR